MSLSSKEEEKISKILEKALKILGEVSKILEETVEEIVGNEYIDIEKILERDPGLYYLVTGACRRRSYKREVERLKRLKQQGGWKTVHAGQVCLCP